VVDTVQRFGSKPHRRGKRLTAKWNTGSDALFGSPSRRSLTPIYRRRNKIVKKDIGVWCENFLPRPIIIPKRRMRLISDLHRLPDLQVFECTDCDMSLIEGAEDLEWAPGCG
jgi:hypothetical protein